MHGDHPPIGIDLGTTNSSVAVLIDGRAEVLRDDDDGLVPSCVGLASDGNIIVGREARNQAVLFPDRTAVSIKRRMGTADQVPLGGLRCSPEEVSAFILQHLLDRAEKALGIRPSRAVITVPAYFTDAQRKATRKAGELAGLKVERILNEPTAASLVYEAGAKGKSRILVYDLGGGTFDVSVVESEKGVVEVLATAGNNWLGGDDFDTLIVERLNRHLESKYGGSLRSDLVIQSRLANAAEAAKRRLSNAPYTAIDEDNLGIAGSKPVNLSYELSRSDFEADIQPLVDSSLRQVDKALGDAGAKARSIDRVLLVGGSTRVPLVARMLKKRMGRAPDGSVDPDRCVALGAALQAGLVAGEEVQAVLVDITPYTFGTRAHGELDGLISPYKFVPLIPRNSKLPVTKSELLYALHPTQERVEVDVYQGERPDVRNNTKIASVLLDGLNRNSHAYADGLLFTFKLDLDGILEFSAHERVTGRKVSGRVEDAMAARSSVESGDSLTMLRDTHVPSPPDSAADTVGPLLDRAERALEKASGHDARELHRLMGKVRTAVKRGRRSRVEELAGELAELLFFLE